MAEEATKAPVVAEAHEVETYSKEELLLKENQLRLS